MTHERATRTGLDHSDWGGLVDRRHAAGGWMDLEEAQARGAVPPGRRVVMVGSLEVGRGRDVFGVGETGGARRGALLWPAYAGDRRRVWRTLVLMECAAARAMLSGLGGPGVCAGVSEVGGGATTGFGSRFKRLGLDLDGRSLAQ